MGVNLMAVAVLSLIWAATDPQIDIPALYRIEAHRLTQWAGPADSPANMPTDVAVDGQGNIYLADGVNHRIIKLTNDGTFSGSIDRFGDDALVRPIGIDVDLAGNLWVADAGLAAVLVFSADGKPLERIDPPGPGQGREIDLTDVAVSADGKRTYLVDNDNHRLLVRDNRSGSFITLGKPGRSLGQLQWPFMICLNDAGVAFVTETIGARVQRLSAADEWTTSIGQWGVELGQLYRPKGIAIDSGGRIFVSDSTTGVIQVFEPSGRKAGVLTDAQGQPLRFEHPMGMCFDGTGRLYVVEMTAHRVAVVRLVSSGEFRVSSESVSTGRTPSASKRASPQPFNSQLDTRNSQLNNARDCAICHLQWLKSFQAADQPLLMPAPTHPVQADENTCLGCHDGSVADSRRSVWLEHGHQTGITPPPGMTVPDRLPLDDGRITCRTCHTAHAGKPGETFANANFTRVPNEQSQLCMMCHADKVGDSPHPPQPPANAIPHPLWHRFPTGERNGVYCLSCHTPHGAGSRNLIAPSLGNNQVCTSCHAQQMLGHASGHDLSGQDMSCLSCHRAHDKRHAALLRDPKDALCANCHSTISQTLSGGHDLTGRTDMVNGLGKSPDQTGRCGFCHDVHNPTGPALWAGTAQTPSTADQQCTLCHADHDRSSMAAMPTLLHPTGPAATPPAQTTKLPLFDVHGARASGGQMACATCHDVHADPVHSPGLLRRVVNGQAELLCQECHQQTETVPWSLHNANLLKHAAPGPKSETLSSSACGPCHAVHAIADATVTKTFSNYWGSTAPRGDAELCLNCHGSDGLASRIERFDHPDLVMKNLLIPTEAGYMPLVDAHGKLASTGHLTCVSCHLPHGRGSQHAVAGLTRETVGSIRHRASLPMVRPYATPNLCSSCHGQEGLRRFLHFHDASQRAELLEQATR